MGREIRMVRPDWEHPQEPGRNGELQYKPLYDRSYANAAAEFLAMANEKGLQEAVEWFGSAPNRDNYMPDWPDAECTHFQVYENVSEGTPVSPHFATKTELVDYLVEHGDFWQQRAVAAGRERFYGKTWLRESAEKFVRDEYAPSFIVHRTPAGTTIDGPETQ